MTKMSDDDKKHIRINLQDFIYPFNKENVTETFFSFIISLLLSFIPTLASFDTNEDGIIDENDTNFANLKILKGNGTLMTLAEAGITSINLNTTSTEITDENGNQQFTDGTFTKTDGTTGEMGAFYFETETSESLSNEWIDETVDIKNLPDIAGRGKLYSLHQAMRHVA